MKCSELSLVVMVLVLAFVSAGEAQQTCVCPWSTDGDDVYNTNVGRIGIGTATPASGLDVRGRFRVGEDGAASVITTHPGSTRFRFRNITPGELIFEFGTEFKVRKGLYDPTAFFVNAAGNVGIGTTSPQERLAVDGKIVAREVRVDADPTSWPDFVFEEGYQLPPLTEVDRFIAQRGHLPGIPTAAEVAEDGVEVGVFQARLLQKIEELTVYLIDLHASNEELRQRVRQLEGRGH